MSEGNVPRPRRSDPPLEELKKERDDFIKQFFAKGAEFTEELVREREAAQRRLSALEEENARLRAQIVPLEAHVGREAHKLAVDLLGVDEEVPGTRELVQATLDLMRGLGLASLLRDDTLRRRRVLRTWADTLDRFLPRKARRPPRPRASL